MTKLSDVVSDGTFLNRHLFKLENGMLKLIASLETKRERGDWVDHLMVRESNAVYVSVPTTPPLQHSTPAEAFS